MSTNQDVNGAKGGNATAIKQQEQLQQANNERREHTKHYVLWSMNMLVFLLSVLLIVVISVDTFNKVQLLDSHKYMTFQFWVCVVFILDFFVCLFLADRKWRFVRGRIFFLLLSIPYLNIISLCDIHLSHEALYFIRFVPLARGALALSIVIGYISKNAVVSMFYSYLSICVLIVYFCSLILFQCEQPVNPDVNSYLTALWWSAMEMVTVGCNISPMTVAGKIVVVILPIVGVVVFPLFTVYIADFVKRNSNSNTNTLKDA